MSLRIVSWFLLWWSFVHICNSFLPQRSFHHGTSIHSCSDTNNDNFNATVSSSFRMMDNDNVTVHPDIFEYVGVRPFWVLQGYPLRRKLSMFTWKTRGMVLRVLHARDPYKPPNSCINLECLWYKALATNNPKSPIYDHGLTHDLLPRLSRFVVNKPWCNFYPNLVHGRLEVRSAYLQQAILKEIEHVRKTAGIDTHVRIISLGAGYDTRSVKLLSEGAVDVCIDMDLPQVIDMKTTLFQSRLRRRRPELTDRDFPILVDVDLNDLDAFRKKLDDVLQIPSSPETGVAWHTIFVAEGVLMYLQEGNSQRLLATCAELARNDTAASLCFADRLGTITNVDVQPCQEELAKASWKLVDFAPNPYLNAKHIGTARLSAV